jgi:hypothetical protein
VATTNPITLSGFNGIGINTIIDTIIQADSQPLTDLLEEAAKLLMVLLSGWEQLVKPQQSIPSVLLTREPSPMAFGFRVIGED